MRVGIVAQRDNETAATLAEKVADALDVKQVTVDPATATALGREGAPMEELSTAELVVSIGGDGTFLFAARYADTTPILGVNVGEVGFLNPVQPSRAVEATRTAVRELAETNTVQTSPLPRVSAHGDGWELSPAINEIAVQAAQRGRGHGIDVTVQVGGRTFTERTVDGILVATPTGSTAYNLSEGGPLIRPSTGVLVVTPMSPTPAARSLVIDDGSTVSLDVMAGSAESAVVLADSSQSQELRLPTTVDIELAGEPARVVGDGVDLFRGLDKLD